MKNFKRTLCVLLSLVLALGMLSACGGGGTAQETPTGDVSSDYVYVPTYTTISGEFDSVTNCVWNDGRLYFLANVVSGQRTQQYDTGNVDADGNPIMDEYTNDIYTTAFFSCAEDGTDVKRLENYVPAVIPDLPENAVSSNGTSGIGFDPDGNIWMLESVSAYIDTVTTDTGATASVTMDVTATASPDATEDATNWWEAYYLRKLDPTGTELLSVDLSTLAGDSGYFYINSFMVGGDGRAYFVDGSNNVTVVDPDGTVAFTVAGGENDYINSLVKLADGRVAGFTYGESGSSASGNLLKIVDADKKAFGDEIQVTSNAWNFINGSGDYDYYYNSGTALYGGKLDGSDPVKLVTWINSDVDGDNLSSVIPMADGRILCCSNTYSDDGNKTELITLTKTPASQVEQKTTLTYACMYINYNIRAQILKFNRSSDKYRIEVKDYSEYNTDDDSSAGLTKLTTEITSGKVPDILSTDSLPIDQYAAKGLLEDLWPFIDADTSLGGRDGVVQPFFNALTASDGGLYQIYSSFQINTVMGASSLVGNTSGWTLDELLAAYSLMPQGTNVFSESVTKTDMLNAEIYMSMDSFVDWSTGKCSFDSDSFVQMLEFANTFPESYDWNNVDWSEYEDDVTRIMSGKQMLAQYSVYDFNEWLIYKQAFGGDVTFVGYPGTGDNGSAFASYSGLAMSSTCADKDGAWEFMRTILTDDYQKDNTWSGFPTNQKTFDSRLKDAMTPQYDAVELGGAELPKTSWWLSSGSQLDAFAMTQAEADQLMELINGTTRMYVYDDQLMAIISDEASAYFAGQKTAQDTANMIQNRVSIYVNEQR